MNSAGENNRERDHKLPVRRHRQHVLGQMSGGFSHAFGATGRTETSFFATEGYNFFFLARLTLKTHESVTEDPTLEISFEFLC